ncbi:MAG: membrane integrity-associated transporter subunit PqiC [Alphaproteobacteria bacterium]|nr:membrane integrity-associated transporter subunit PqiC [Alphaproteobacteria bacterium]MDE2042640.1 membrane integrity-associated transporter subunit PqiC [Alphaproteobacteria bacterium]MDE2339686.1 membrane integrity-associated transporter subunit PqiC [Alphaproteobacteria bacterium]
MRRIALIMAGLALIEAGCVNVNVGGKPAAPLPLMTLTPATGMPVDAGHVLNADSAVRIDAPLSPSPINVTRIPVYGSDGSISYVRGAFWTDPPATLFRALLGEVVVAHTGRAVLDPRVTSARAGTVLGGTLLRFGIDEAGHQAVVTFDAILTRNGQGTFTRRFEARAPVAAINGTNSAAALNDAANQVAAQVADWIKATP